MRLLPRQKLIGIDRTIRLEWLEKTAYLVLAGNNASTVKKTLQENIKEAFRSKNTNIRGSLNKTVTILMRIWANPPKDSRALYEKGLEFLSRMQGQNCIAIHWGMTMAVYPFWGAVATYVGRLLRLQGTVTVSQVQRRIGEQYGENATVPRATQRVIRNFVYWQALNETDQKGIYTHGPSVPIDNVELIAWLAEAFLISQGKPSVPLDTILNSPIFFPFNLDHVSGFCLAEASERLDLLRHGLDQELIILKNNLK